ncbi:P2 family phage major capsid protein, partial [Escherichia coli]
MTEHIVHQDKFNAYLSRVAELNGIDAGDVSKKFTVEPSVTQTL